MARKEQNRKVSSRVELVAFVVSITGAVVGVVALASRGISL